MDYSWYNRQTLLEMLNDNLNKSRRESHRLSGSLSKLKSGKAVLLSRRDTTKAQVHEYVNKVSTALLEFQSEMLREIREAMTKKFKDLDVLKERYEERINSHIELCSEAEKLTQVGQELESQADKETAVRILQTFESLFKADSTDSHFTDIIKLELHPSLKDTEIQSEIFGELVTGQSAETPSSSSNALRARASTSSTLTNKSTQCDQNNNQTQTEIKTNQNNNNTSVSKVQLSKSSNDPSSISQKVTMPPGLSSADPPRSFTSPPPGMNASVPPGFNAIHTIQGAPPPGLGTSTTARSYTSPPPGMNAFPQMNTMQTAMQMNPFMMNNNLCNTIPTLYAPAYRTVSPPLQQFQQTPFAFQFVDPNFNCQNFAFQAQMPTATQPVRPPSVSTSSGVTFKPPPVSFGSTNITIRPPVPVSSSPSLIQSSVTVCSTNSGTQSPIVATTDSGSGVKSHVSVTNTNTAESAKGCVKKIAFKDSPVHKSASLLMRERSSSLNDSRGIESSSDKEELNANKESLIEKENAEVVTDSSISKHSNDFELTREIKKELIESETVTDGHGKDNKSIGPDTLLQSILKRTKSLELTDKIDLIERTDEAENYTDDDKQMDSEREIVTQRNTSPSALKPLRKPFQLTKTLLNASITSKESTGSSESTVKSTDGEDVDGPSVTRSTDSHKTNNLSNDYIPCSPKLNDNTENESFRVKKTADNLQSTFKGRSSRKNKTLQDLVSVNSPSKNENSPTKKNAEPNGKDRLISQRSWFKGFMQKSLEKNDKGEKKNPTDSTVLKDLTIKIENTEQSDHSREVRLPQSCNREVKTDKWVGSDSVKDMTIKVERVEQSDVSSPHKYVRNVDIKTERSDLDWETDINRSTVVKEAVVLETEEPPAPPPYNLSKLSKLGENVKEKSDTNTGTEKKMKTSGGFLINAVEKSGTKVEKEIRSTGGFKKNAVEESNEKVQEQVKTTGVFQNKDVVCAKVVESGKGTGGFQKDGVGKKDQTVEEHLKSTGGFQKKAEEKSGAKVEKQNKTHGGFHIKTTEPEKPKLSDKEASKASSKPAEENTKAEVTVELRKKKPIKPSVVTRFIPPSPSKRLGALQSHWLARTGRNIKAKHLFTCTGDLHFPIGVTTNSIGEIIITDTGNHCMKMYGVDGKFIKEFGKSISPALRRPSAVVVNEFDYIYVKDDIAVRVFDKTGQYMQSIGKRLFSKPFGLALTPTKCLLVLETDRSHPELVHLSQDGSQVWKFLYTPLTQAHPNSKCRFMTVAENNVLVSDLGLSVVYITTFEGVFLKTVAGFGPNSFYEPSGLSVDIYGNVVIGDSKNNRIQVYKYDGLFTGMIDFDDTIVRPAGVHLTNNNRLLVVSLLRHNVKVYELGV